MGSVISMHIDGVRLDRSHRVAGSTLYFAATDNVNGRTIEGV